MSKKLLEESTIRSFMKLANLAPLSDKFIKESWKQEEALNEEEHEEEEEEEEDEDDKKKVDESAPPDTEETAHSRDRLEEEEELEEGEDLEEGKESEGRPASPKPKVKGVAKPGKMDAAKNAPKDAKMKALSAGTHHSDRDDTIDTKGHSNAPKKNNAQFELVAESLEEEMDEEAAAPEGDMGSAGEGGDHQAKMKGLIRDMLDKLSEMGSEYGMSMEVSDEGGGDEGSPEGGEAPPAPEAAGEEEKLQEMIEKLTNRVAARLVKESKKKR